MKTSLRLLLLFAIATGAFAQSKKLPLLAASTREATVADGEHVRLNWKCDPKADPDVYYVNVPRQNSKVTFQTD